MVVDTVYAISEAPEVLVVVDQNGNGIQTSTLAPTASVSYSYGSRSTIFPSTSSSASSSTPAASSSSVAVVAPVIQAVQSVVSSAAPASSSASSSSSPSGSCGYGTAYSPYMANSACKDQTQVNQDVAGFASQYSSIRIYGTSCNQVVTVLQAAKSNGLKVILGIESISNPNPEIQTIISAVNGDWSDIQTVVLGNEDVNDGIASVADVISALGTTRGILRAAGYTGPVVHVDTMTATLNHPELADASDLAAFNIHAYFDGSTLPPEAGPFIQGQVALLRAKLSDQNKQILITETGWPTLGPANGDAIPSGPNQAAAINSIKSAFPCNVTFLSAYNDKWKATMLEASFGILGDAPS